MKISKGTALGAAAMLLALSPVIAAADHLDDYAACLIGKAAVALHQQGSKKDIDKAQSAAYKHCKKPKISEDDAEGLGDFVNLNVMAIADGMYRQ